MFNAFCYVLTIRPYCLQKVIKIGGWLSKIQQPKAVSFSRHGIQHDWKDTISGVHVNARNYAPPGSAETSVRTGGITIHHLIAYSLSNISAKNYQNRLICIEVIVCNTSVVFWDTVYLQHISYSLVVQFPEASTVLMELRLWFGFFLLFVRSSESSGTGQYYQEIVCWSIQMIKTLYSVDDLLVTQWPAVLQ